MTVTLDGKKLKAARKAMGLSQEKLAEKSDLSDRHIRNMENGKVDPSASTLCRVCVTLEISMADILIVVRNDED